MRILCVASESVSAKIMYHDGLAHEVEAGADLFPMPSCFQPFGLELNQS